MRPINKRGQQTMGMPFGMIFAIFLIVVFVVIAFMAVNMFLDLGRSSNVGLFYEELQDAVNDALAGQSSSSKFKIDLPSEIKSICFANLSQPITNPGPEYEAIKDYVVYHDANTFLIPPESAPQGMNWKVIKHIGVAKITASENPYCVDTDSDLKINKDFYDKLVWIE